MLLAFGLQGQQIWQQYCSNPRESTSQRIDTGCSHDRNNDKTEKAWLQERRKGISDAMVGNPDLPLEEIQGNSRMLTSHLMSEAVLAEQSFQRDKQHRNRMQASLDKCLLEAEVDREFLEVAQAYKDRMAKADDQHAALRKRKADILNPRLLPDPMTKNVFIVDNAMLKNDDMMHGVLRGCLVGDPEHANYIVENDPSDPQDPLAQF